MTLRCVPRSVQLMAMATIRFRRAPIYVLLLTYSLLVSLHISTVARALANCKKIITLSFVLTAYLLD